MQFPNALNILWSRVLDTRKTHTPENLEKHEHESINSTLPDAVWSSAVDDKQITFRFAKIPVLCAFN